MQLGKLKEGVANIPGEFLREGDVCSYIYLTPHTYAHSYPILPYPNLIMCSPTQSNLIQSNPNAH